MGGTNVGYRLLFLTAEFMLCKCAQLARNRVTNFMAT